jgi:hypothetical protein
MSTAGMHRRQIERLRRLGVALAPVDPQDQGALLRRFAEAFVDPAQRGAFAAALGGARPIDYDRFVRPECVRAHAPCEGSLAWLSGGARAARCYRLERNPRLPAVNVVVRSIAEAWATSWPGMFVSFESGRALVVTLDYERIHCDLWTATPYR